MRKLGQFDIQIDVFIRNEQAYKALLDERSFEMLRLRTLEDMTYNSIAMYYGLSTERISQVLSRSRERIEKARYEM